MRVRVAGAAGTPGKPALLGTLGDFRISVGRERLGVPRPRLLSNLPGPEHGWWEGRKGGADPSAGDLGSLGFHLPPHE